MNPVLGMIVVTVALVVLLVAVRRLQKRFGLNAELTRKLVHVGIGLIALSFAFLFDTAWPVIVVCLVGMVGMKMLRRSRSFGRQIEDLVGVERITRGEHYFPVTVALLFILSAGSPILYCVPLLILTFADAAAAVVGIQYGFFHYKTQEGIKSTEGSLVFFVVAFFSAHIALLLFSDLGRVETLLVALLVAFITMIMEAVCYRGLDNLLIPLITLMVLKSSMPRSTFELSLAVSVALGLVVFIFLLRRRTGLSGSALLGVILVGYLSWLLGGSMWMLAPFMVFVVNAVLFRPAREKVVGHHADVVLCVSAAGLFWLLLAGATDRAELLVPFAIAFSAQLAMLCVRHLRSRSAQLHGVTIVTASGMIGWVLVLLPYALLGVFDGMISAVALWSLLGVFLATGLLYRRHAPQDADVSLPWKAQCIYGGIASLFGLVPLYVL